jgi:uncharacterized membrane protein YhaH (DUF805 family)
MFWYLQALEKYADFSSRAGRREYWSFVLVNAVISYGLGSLLNLNLHATVQATILAFVLVFSLVMFLPDWAVTVRRLHDTGHSGWAVLIALVPFIGWFVLLIWLLTESDVDQNEYGPDPIEWARSKAERLSDTASKRLFAILTLMVVLTVLLAGCIVYAARRGTEEARALAPWPASGVSAEHVANFDLTVLGLRATGQRDARSIYGQAFADGAVIEYGAAGNVVAVVAALRYASNSDAAIDFESFEAWAQVNCGKSLTSQSGEVGIIHCDFAESHDVIAMGNNWILDVEATTLGDMAPVEVTSKISAAAAAHWHGSAGGL